MSSVKSKQKNLFSKNKINEIKKLTKILKINSKKKNNSSQQQRKPDKSRDLSRDDKWRYRNDLDSPIRPTTLLKNSLSNRDNIKNLRCSQKQSFPARGSCNNQSNNSNNLSPKYKQNQIKNHNTTYKKSLDTQSSIFNDKHINNLIKYSKKIKNIRSIISDLQIKK